MTRPAGPSAKAAWAPRVRLGADGPAAFPCFTGCDPGR
jgi:hypothetical protein